MTETQAAFKFTPQHEATFVYQLEQDADWWPALLCQYITLHGDALSALKSTILENPEEWKKAVQEARACGMGVVRRLAAEKPTQWNLRIKLLLADPVHARLLEFYLKSLIMLKGRRVLDVGARAETRQRINAILAVIANDALTGLDKLAKANAYLASGMTAGGRILPAESRAFYEEMQRESAALVTSLLAVIFLFKDAQCTADIRQLQQYINTNLVKPLEIKTGILTDPGATDYKSKREKLRMYQKLLQAVEITFE